MSEWIPTGQLFLCVYLSFIMKSTKKALDYVGQCVLISLFVSKIRPHI